MIASSILIACFLIMPGFGQWEACGPPDAFGFGICSVSDNSVLFSLVSVAGKTNEIYKSDNGGATWEFSSLVEFQQLYFDSDCFNRVIASGGSKILISSDLGNSWNQYTMPGNSYCRSIASDPSDSLRMLGAVTQCTGPLIESVDGGQTWQTMGSNPGISGYSVAFCSENADVVYLAGRNNENNHLVVLKSSDGGSTWEDVTPFTVSINPEPALTITVSENPDRVIFAKHSDVYITSDGGSSWQQVLTSTSYLYDLKFIDSQGSAFAIQQAKLYSTSDYGETWTTYTDVPRHTHSFTCGTSDTIHIASYYGLYSADSPAGPWTATNTGIYGGEHAALAENHLDPSGFPVFTGDYFLNEEQFSFEDSGLFAYVGVSHAGRGAEDPDLLFAAGNPG